MQAHIDKNITSRQSTCTPSNDTGFSERRVFDPLRNIRVVSCESGGKKCKNTSTGNMGICFFPNGSSASTGDRKEWLGTYNPGNYLEKNLRHSINYIENNTNIDLIAIGIGHDVSRYYSKAVTIMDVDQLGEVLLNELSNIFTSK